MIKQIMADKTVRFFATLFSVIIVISVSMGLWLQQDSFNTPKIELYKIPYSSLNPDVIALIREAHIMGMFNGFAMAEGFKRSNIDLPFDEIKSIIFYETEDYMYKINKMHQK